MSIRTSTIVLAFATIAAPIAFAQSPLAGDERGGQSGLSREQVTAEYLAFRKNPVAPDGGRYVGGDVGYVFPQHAYVYQNEQGWTSQSTMQGGLTREQVTSDYLAFRSNPVASDGGRYVGGDVGYVFPHHSYAYQNGQWECVDGIAHNPAPAAIMTPAERAAFWAQHQG